MITIKEKEVVTESNGNEFWLREFDYDESLERVSLLERRGIEFQIKVGLELLRAKWQLTHGEFIPFLAKSGFQNTDAPGRRLKVAREYMAFLGLIESPKLINPAKSEVLKALEVAYSQNPQFADFQDYRKANPDVEDFAEHMLPKYREPLGMKVDLFSLIGFNPYYVKNHLFLKWRYLTPVEKAELFMLLHNCILTFKGLLQSWKDKDSGELQSELERVKAEGKIADSLSNFMGGV